MPEKAVPLTESHYIPRGRNELHKIFDSHFQDFNFLRSCSTKKLNISDLIYFWNIKLLVRHSQNKRSAVMHSYSVRHRDWRIFPLFAHLGHCCLRLIFHYDNRQAQSLSFSIFLIVLSNCLFFFSYKILFTELNTSPVNIIFLIIPHNFRIKAILALPEPLRSFIDS